MTSIFFLESCVYSGIFNQDRHYLEENQFLKLLLFWASNGALQLQKYLVYNTEEYLSRSKYQIDNEIEIGI